MSTQGQQSHTQDCPSQGACNWQGYTCCLWRREGLVECSTTSRRLPEERGKSEWLGTAREAPTPWPRSANWKTRTRRQSSSQGLPPTPPSAGASPTLQTRKPRLQEVEALAQGHQLTSGTARSVPLQRTRHAPLASAKPLLELSLTPLLLRPTVPLPSCIPRLQHVTPLWTSALPFPRRP